MSKLRFLFAEGICQVAYQNALGIDLSAPRGDARRGLLKTHDDVLGNLEKQRVLWKELPSREIMPDKETLSILTDLCADKLNQTEINIGLFETRFVAEKIYERGIDSCCLLGTVILYQRLKKRNIPCRIMVGYKIMGGFAVRHVWLDVHGEEMDVGFHVAALHHSELSSVPPEMIVCSLSIPPGTVRGDQDTEEEKQQLAKLEQGITVLKTGISKYVYLIGSEADFAFRVYLELTA